VRRLANHAFYQPKGKPQQTLFKTWFSGQHKTPGGWKETPRECKRVRSFLSKVAVAAPMTVFLEYKKNEKTNRAMVAWLLKMTACTPLASLSKSDARVCGHVVTVPPGDVEGKLIGVLLREVFPSMTPLAAATNTKMWQDIALSVAGARAHDYLFAMCTKQHGSILPFNDSTWLSHSTTARGCRSRLCVSSVNRELGACTYRLRRPPSIPLATRGSISHGRRSGSHGRSARGRTAHTTQACRAPAWIQPHIRREHFQLLMRSRRPFAVSRLIPSHLTTSPHQLRSL